LHRTGWIKTQPARKLLVRVKFTRNSFSYRTCVNVNGHYTGVYWNPYAPGLILVSMWMHP